MSDGQGKTTYSMSPMIGETIYGMQYPIFFDPHYACIRNNPPVTLVTGSPGSGKTFYALVLASHASIVGKIGAVIDPKGDFTCLYEMEKRKEINKIRVWSLMNIENNELAVENEGMLDPVLFEDNVASNTTLTIDIIKLLVGSITSKQNASLAPIIQDVITRDRNPSFARVVQKLMEQNDDELRSLGASLDIIVKTPLAKLLVTNKNVERKPLDFTKGLVILNLMGLKLPSDTKEVNQYTTDEKVSICIMSLITKLVYNILSKIPKTKQKILIIDEAWAMSATQEGRNLIAQVGRLGRSLNMAMILLSQSPTHIEKEDNADLDTMISSRFAFRNKNVKDNYITTKAMKLSENEGFEETIENLDTGECLMQDLDGQLAFIKIIAQDGWGEIFNTNPLEAIKKQRQKQ